MPNMDGIETVKLDFHKQAGKSQESFCHVMMITTMSGIPSRIKFADYILKYDINSSLIEELLDKITNKIINEKTPLSG